MINNEGETHAKLYLQYTIAILLKTLLINLHYNDSLDIVIEFSGNLFINWFIIGTKDFMKIVGKCIN